MSRRRALFISGDLPWPPDGGGRIASLRLLEAYATLFAIDLIAIADPVGEPDLGRLHELCDRVTVVRHPFTFGRHRVRQMGVAVRSAASRQPYRLRKFSSPELRKVIAEHRESGAYVVVHHDQFGVAPYHSDTLPSTMTHQNVESDLYRLGAERARDPIRRLWLERERDKLARSEATLLRAFDHVFALAFEDAELLRQLGLERVSVIPMPAPPTVPDRVPPTEHGILSLGSMSWFGVSDGLLWFGREVFPLIKAKVPDVRWRIVGAHASGPIRDLARQPGVELLGHVHDLGSVVATTRVGVVPLMVAGGIRMKLLDLMAWRVPAVATSLAARGLDFAEGSGAFRRDTPEGFADAVVGLLTDDQRWTVSQRRGAEYVSVNHSPDRLSDVVAAGVEDAMSHHAARSGRSGA